jgi:hypothetical protein
VEDVAVTVAVSTHGVERLIARLSIRREEAHASVSPKDDPLELKSRIGCSSLTARAVRVGPSCGWPPQAH